MNRAVTSKKYYMRLLALAKRGCGLDVMQVRRASYIFEERQGTGVSVNNLFSLIIFIPFCCYHHSIQTQVQYKHNSYFISIGKLRVWILDTDHHLASYKTACKR
jgi:hypothetical protein